MRIRALEPSVEASIATPVVGALDELAVTAREVVGRAYRENRQAIYSYLVALGTNPAEAQDLAQEAFLKLYVAIRKGQRIENLRAWLFTVASNLALNQHRARQYRPAATEEEIAAWLQTQTDPRSDPEQALLDTERAVHLNEAIRGLSRQQQACLHLRAEGFRYREIARILGVTLPTVGE
ncbi:MAG: RNA polymerase sigma factor, partial [Candidatus Acidiferrales bacterium]